MSESQGALSNQHDVMEMNMMTMLIYINIYIYMCVCVYIGGVKKQENDERMKAKTFLFTDKGMYRDRTKLWKHL